MCLLRASLPALFSPLPLLFFILLSLPLTLFFSPFTLYSLLALYFFPKALYVSRANCGREQRKDICWTIVDFGAERPRAFLIIVVVVGICPVTPFRK